ncbi:MAG: cytochrome d ubiquinol oxidase subunit II [Gemmatimonadetes bacterium]|nr:cytochrome d ubiquinol oxidase subunit II [Gemmatimonadota bacterium]NIO31490.1 cytochrome d ubiquinol oxidase subunit II [Gemmatimonadota bacterium]
MDLPTIWFLLVGVLIIGYAVLDGFDLGVGVLYLFARSEEERRIYLNAIGPVWDGNEVWLLTGGGALFAAFPVVYATVFSAFYLAMMLVVVALIARAVSFEFRGKLEGPGWKRLWDWCFGVGSLLAAVLYGVAVGNVVGGIPIDASGTFTGSFLGLLDPLALLCGLMSLAMFTMQGAAYMCLKSEDELRERMRGWTMRGWLLFAALYAVVTVLAIFAAPHAFEGVLANPLFWILLVLFAASATSVPLSNRRGRYGRTFLATSVTIASLVGLTAVGMFPRVVASSIDLANSLTIYNSASTPRTQTAMLIIALIGMPIVLAYTAYVYKVFKGKVVFDEASY